MNQKLNLPISLSKMSISEAKSVTTYHCSEKSAKTILEAIDEGAQYIVCPSDNKKGTTRYKIPHNWFHMHSAKKNMDDSMQEVGNAYTAFHTAWMIDGRRQWEDFEYAAKKFKEEYDKQVEYMLNTEI